MGEHVEFNLDENVNHWIGKVQSDPSFTDSDSEELKSHLFDLIDELRDSGLDEEEAFIIASKRLGNNIDWGEEYREANNPVIQMRRSLVILAGVLAYFLCYYFIQGSSKLLFIILELLDVKSNIAIVWVSRYVISWHFLFIIFLTSIYFLESKTVAFIERINLKPKHTLVVVVIVFIFALTDILLSPLIINFLKDTTYLLSEMRYIYRNFKFSFPSLIIIGFIFIYYRYYKKAKI